MSWWGKGLGLGFGFLAGGPVGALLGGALGYSADRGFNGRRRVLLRYAPGAGARVMENTFMLLGAVASVGGVAQKEVDWVEHLLADMKLNRAQCARLRTAFNAGRQPDFAMTACIARLQLLLVRDGGLTETIIHVLTRLARSDPPIHRRQARLIHQVGVALGVTHAWMVEQLGRSGGQTEQTVADPYAILGVSAQASSAEVKLQYRRLMQRYHPDRLGPSAGAEDRARAASRYAEVRRAWEAIRVTGDR